MFRDAGSIPAASIGISSRGRALPGSARLRELFFQLEREPLEGRGVGAANPSITIAGTRRGCFASGRRRSPGPEDEVARWAAGRPAVC